VPDQTVFVFGAGATKACGGPLTNEILPDAFEIWESFPGLEREGFLELVNDYLIDRYHVPERIADRSEDDYPDLPRLLAMLDATIERGSSLGPDWPPDKLRTVRAGLEYLIFSLLQHKLVTIDANYYYQLFELCAEAPVAISLNYDIIVDNAFCRWAEESGSPGFPDYGAEISTAFYRQMPKVGELLKLHGSLNWYFCPACESLFVGVAESGRFHKVLEELYVEDPLEPRYSCRGSQCRECGANVTPILITPSHQRDYENPRIREVWEQAERALSDAARVVIVGYSLPPEDVYVNSLLLTCLSNVSPSDITVVDRDPEGRSLRDHPVGRQYYDLFGEELDWHTEGFAAWVAQETQDGSRF
jgi:hypothetical protein